MFPGCVSSFLFCLSVLFSHLSITDFLNRFILLNRMMIKMMVLSKVRKVKYLFIGSEGAECFGMPPLNICGLSYNRSTVHHKLQYCKPLMLLLTDTQIKLNVSTNHVLFLGILSSSWMNSSP